MRHIFARRHSDLDNASISTLLGTHWKQLTSTERKEFQDSADLEKEQHRLKYPAYKYQPKVAKKRLTKSLKSPIKAVRAVKHDISKLVDRVTPCQLDFDISETETVFPFDTYSRIDDESLISVKYSEKSDFLKINPTADNLFISADDDFVDYMPTDFHLYNSESPYSASFLSDEFLLRVVPSSVFDDEYSTRSNSVNSDFSPIFDDDFNALLMLPLFPFSPKSPPCQKIVFDFSF